jgi:hypothetical protein
VCDKNTFGKKDLARLIYLKSNIIQNQQGLEAIKLFDAF